MREAGIDEEDELRLTTELLKKEFQRMYTILHELEESHDLTNAIQYAIIIDFFFEGNILCVCIFS